jgi:hypothetical protein
MTALRWTGMACRVIALAVATWMAVTTLPALVDTLWRHELRIELRPRMHPIQRGPTWT